MAERTTMIAGRSGGGGFGRVIDGGKDGHMRSAL